MKPSEDASITIPIALGSESFQLNTRQVCSVRIELNCWTSSWCHRELLGLGSKTFISLVTRSEVLCEK